LERHFDSKEDQKQFKRRISIKLKSDKSVSFQRPDFFKWPWQKKFKSQLFETQIRKAEEDEIFNELDARQAKINGVWSFEDIPSINEAKVKIETVEGDDDTKIRHDTRCKWGKHDGYAAQFYSGKIVKYKVTPAGIPYGAYTAGHFSMYANPHRVLVSKDFQAFQ
jgi:hypothetical protein